MKTIVLGRKYIGKQLFDMFIGIFKWNIAIVQSVWYTCLKLMFFTSNIEAISYCIGINELQPQNTPLSSVQ